MATQTETVTVVATNGGHGDDGQLSRTGLKVVFGAMTFGKEGLSSHKSAVQKANLDEHLNRRQVRS